MFDYQLPENWKWVMVEDVQAKEKRATITGPFGSSIGSKFFVEEGIPVIRGNNLTLGMEKFKDDGFAFITEQKAEELKGYKAFPGDVLFTAAGTIGQVGMIPENCKHEYYIISNKQMRARFDTDLVDPEFAYYWFSSKPMVAYIKALDTGSTIPLINLGILRKLPMPLPPLEEQKKIKKQLTTLDNKIEINRQTNQTLENISQAIFKSWFVDFDPTRAKILAKEQGQNPELAAMAAIAGKEVDELEALSGDQLAKLKSIATLFPDNFEDTGVGLIPEGWESSSLGEHFDVIMGQSPKGDTYNENGDGMMFFQGRRDFGFRYPKPRVYTTDPKRVANAGDTLISVRAPVGDRNMAATECCLGRGVASIRHKSGARSFTYAFIGHIEGKLGDSGSDGTVFSSINKNELGAVSFVAPNERLVVLFEELLSPTDQRIEINSQEISSLEQIRDSLLPKLLSGELEVASAN
ncbi:restriction endonuclease subunit S [Pseudoalteromonas sp. CNC9-20]|uniref:restriction endonuclease subunit S n=1 Tax=Pseudoalteromonas sp. CNC9-20 TaxID=2917750 RepID=UPI001EF56795|nr:restriction endonuclease subunit S [Pseudoalteromonas sp. CNC9-20]MCG7570772.1 restriction endonuclease subunit S [Pseudoalteromonas sp. CNC9-20]